MPTLCFPQFLINELVTMHDRDLGSAWFYEETWSVNIVFTA